MGRPVRAAECSDETLQRGNTARARSDTLLGPEAPHFWCELTASVESSAERRAPIEDDAGTIGPVVKEGRAREPQLTSEKL